MDALGFTERIKGAGSVGLANLACELEHQFHRFNARIPYTAMVVTPSDVVGTGEYATLRLNDMFVLHATKHLEEVQLRFLLCGSLLFQSLLLANQIPRGGLGIGPIYRTNDLLIGNGFIDAYEAAEKRDPASKDVCAVQISASFMHSLPNAERIYRLLCFYRGRFYVHPWFLTDPEMGEFTPERIMTLLKNAGANQTKLEATQHFLENLEDYDAAKLPGSVTRQLLDAAGAPWTPKSSEAPDQPDRS